MDDRIANNRAAEQQHWAIACLLDQRPRYFTD